jgi:hypothetical protein
MSDHIKKCFYFFSSRDQIKERRVENVWIAKENKQDLQFESESYLYEGAKKIKNHSPIVQTFYGRQSGRLFIIKNSSIRAQLAYVITHAFKWTEICPGDYDFFTTVHAKERKEEKRRTFYVHVFVAIYRYGQI